MEKTVVINNRYMVTDKIGEGGMGKVYRVKDMLQDNMEFAMKTVKSGVFKEKSEEMQKRFKREFEIMTRLKHPNLVRVHDFITDREENCYIVMEYVPGTTLGSILKEEKSISTGKAVDIIVQMLRALDFMHSRDIIYRDIKPDNIIISGETAKLADFGISDTGRGERDRIKGTVVFMAPEVLSGEITPLVDIFALGAVFYQMVTGSVFYKGDDYNLSTIVKILKDRGQFNDIKSRVLDDINNEGVRHIIEGMTAFEKEKRFQSCADIITAINKDLEKNYEIETSETKEAYVLGSPFIGRQFELDEMISVLNDESNSRMLMICGSSGSGKSRLLAELKKYCQLSNILVIDAFCPKDDKKPYGVFIPVLKRIFLHLKKEAVIRYAPYLKRIMPRETIFEKVNLGPVEDFKKERTAIVDAVSRIIGDFTASMGKKAVMIIDDLSYADEFSIDIISAVLRDMKDCEYARGLLRTVYSAISDESSDKLSKVFTAGSSVKRILLKPFSSETVREYIEGLFGSENIDKSLKARIDDIREQVGGNPYFLEEFIKILVQKDALRRKSRFWSLAGREKEMEGFKRIRNIIFSRISSMDFDKKQKEALCIIALTGKELSLRQMSMILDRYERGFINSLVRELERVEIMTSIIREDGVRYRIASRILKEVVLLDMPDKKPLHLYLARRFEEVFRDCLDEYMEEIAFHYQKGGLKEKASLYFEMAGDLALKNYHYGNASGFYSRALSRERTNQSRDLSLYLKKIDSMTKDNQWKESLKLLETIRPAVSGDILFGKMYLLCSVNHYMLADYTRAAEFAELSLKHMLQAFGYENSRTIESLTQLAAVFHAKGEYSRALEGFKRALDIQLRLEGGDSITTAELYNDIGVIYWYKGEFENALEFVEKSLEIKIHILGIKSPDVSVGYNNIGLIYSKMNLYEKAIYYYNLSMDIILDIFGKRHLSVATEYHNIGMIYEKMEKYDDALRYYRESIEIRKVFYDYDHPDIANSYHNIGGIYIRTKKNEKALYYITRAMEIWLKYYGEEHPYIATSYNHLGYIYSNLGDYEKALSYHEKALQIRMKVFGKDHYEVFTLYYNLADTLFHMGSYEKSLHYYQLLKEYENKRGGGKKDLIAIYCNIGRICIKLGRKDNGRENLHAALDMSISFYGKEDKKTLEIRKAIEELE